MDRGGAGLRFPFSFSSLESGKVRRGGVAIGFEKENIFQYGVSGLIEGNT
jgi:hypothetical protein